jgi:hypothetical protein
LGKAFLGGVDVALGRGLCLLLERVKDIDRVSQASRVEVPESSQIVISSKALPIDGIGLRSSG